MIRYFIRLSSILAIFFVCVPFLSSLKAKHGTSGTLTDYEKICLSMPDGSRCTVSADEYFIGAAAAYFPDVSSTDALLAACVILNTSELTQNGVLYLSPEKRSELFGDECDKMDSLYLSAYDAAYGQSIVLPENFSLSLQECMDILSSVGGNYTERLAAVFPGGGIKYNTLPDKSLRG